MKKMKRVVAIHGKKIFMVAATASLAGIAFVGRPHAPTATYANQHYPTNALYGVVDNRKSVSSLGEAVFAGPLADQEIFTKDVVFVTNEYDPNKEHTEWLPIQGVVYEVYDMNDDWKLVGQGVSDEQGKFTLQKLPVGDYSWTQRFVPDRYIPMTTDGTVDGPADYAYFSVHEDDEEMSVLGNLTVYQADDGPILDIEGNIVDEVGNPLDKDGNVIPEEVIPPIEEGFVPEKDPNEPNRDENGNIIGEDGTLTDDNGNRVDKDGHYIDEEDRLINNEGHLVDKDGNLVNEDGHLVDEDGNLIDKDGYFVGVDKTVDKTADTAPSQTLPPDKFVKVEKPEREAEQPTEEEFAEVNKQKSHPDDPEDVQTYDAGSGMFVLIGFSGLIGLMTLTVQKRRI